MLEIEIPQNTHAKVEGEYISIEGSLGISKKRFNNRYINVKVEGNKIIVEEPKDRKPTKMYKFIEGTLANEIRKAFVDLDKGIVVNMRTVYAHFPISLEIKGNKLLIKNIFGSRTPREAKIVGDTKIETKGQDLVIKGSDAYDIGQTVANIRNACKAKGYDSRVFQDGIYVVREE